MSLTTAVIDVLRPIAFRGKGRLLNPLVPDTGDVTVDLFGFSLDLDLSDHIQRGIYLGAYERHTTAVVKRVLARGDSFLDVGANVGYFTLLGACCVGRTGNVVAIEPSPSVARRLEHTIARNDLRHARLYQLGVGDTTGSFELVAPLPGNHTPSFLMQPMAGRESTEVSVVTLDDAIAGWFPNSEPIALLKVDIEGAELGMLRGGARTLESGRVRRVLIEENERWLRKANGSKAALRSLLASYGFVIEETVGDEMVLWRYQRGTDLS